MPKIVSIKILELGDIGKLEWKKLGFLLLLHCSHWTTFRISVDKMMFLWSYLLKRFLILICRASYSLEHLYIYFIGPDEIQTFQASKTCHFHAQFWSRKHLAFIWLYFRTTVWYYAKLCQCYGNNQLISDLLQFQVLMIDVLCLK